MSRALALFVKNYIGELDEDIDDEHYRPVHFISKVKRLMKKLRSANKQGKLREAECDLAPIVSNATRWSSCYAMLSRYIQIFPFIDQSDRDIMPLLLSPLDHADVERSLPILKKLNDITVSLQK
jgi:hypothetical protein